MTSDGPRLISISVSWRDASVAQAKFDEVEWCSGTSETTGMTDQSSQIAALLHEAGETHHLVYRIVDGDDPTGRRGTATGS